jgi:hypothetical protein
MMTASRPSTDQHPVTPDRRYFVVRGRLWRTSDPSLPPVERDRLVSELMAARRDVGSGLRSGDDAAVDEARGRVDAAKPPLGERGPPWWEGGAPDLNRHLVRNTEYADWFAALGDDRPASD